MSDDMLESDEELAGIVNVEEQVAEAVTMAVNMSTDLDIQANINSDDDDVQQFCTRGCGCTLFKGQPCSSIFSESRMRDARYTAMEMTHNELDLVILGKLSACTNCDDVPTTYW